MNIQHREKQMKKYFDVLMGCPLFAGIAEKDLFTMLTCLGAKVERFDKKYTIMGERNPAKYIGILLSGSAQIIQYDFYGNKSILSNIAPSDMFGEAFACAETSAIPVSVIAGDACDVMLIDCTHILHTCENHCGFHQQMIFNLMRDLATKTILFHQKIDVTGKRTTRDKLLTYLKYQAARAGSQSFDIPFNRQELADYLEVDRSGLSVEISKLRREGVLESEKNHFDLFL